ncbi:MAG: hypothetical protein CGU28_03020 [Candidatus Dactylopiibacterium carminicum]|nr:MAG: hypothetical protein CGU28_03020 [Candidatus Dactylopiibacterium carminicum]
MLLFNIGVQASPATDALSNCLTDHTTGKDRKDLARWIFVAMSAHPEIAAITKSNAADIEATQRTMGELFTRLIAEQCPAQMNAVAQAEGVQGIKLAFEHLGKVAMQELTTNPEVNAAIGGFQRYLDQEKINRALRSGLK